MESLKERPQMLEQFVNSVRGWVEEKSREYPHPNDGDAFSHWAIEMILSELDNDAIFELVEIAGKDDQGLDAYYRDEEDGVFYIFQSKYSQNPRGANRSPSYGVGVARELFNAYQLLSNPLAAYKISDKLGKIADEFCEAMGKNYEIRFSYVLFGWFSENAHKEIDARIETLQYPNISKKVYNLDEIYSLYLQMEDPQEVTTPITFPFYSYSELEGFGPKAVIVNVNLVQFALSVTRQRPEIYSANVRNPLGYNMVNKGMRKTLQDAREREYFWHYNNGITILCNEVNLDDDNKQITLIDPTIINGCQTTETVITNIEYIGNTEIPLLVRIIELPNHRIDEIDTALKIARYTNSQTQVVAPDLRSTDEIQTEIKMSFENLPSPWFYERKRGEWNLLKRMEEIDIDDYDRRVKMPEIAQQWYAFDGHPAEAISNKSNLFESDEIYNSIFYPNRTAFEYAVPHLIFSRLKDLLKERLETERSKDSPNERIIRLTRAITLASAQMLALTRTIIEEKFGGYNLEISREVFNQLRDEANNPVDRIFPVLLGCLLHILNENPEETPHSIFRNKYTFIELNDNILTEQINLAQDTYDISPLDAFNS